MQAVSTDDLQREADGELPLYGRSLPLMLETSTSGIQVEEQGERVWRIGVVSEGALAMEFLLDQVDVPAGAYITILPQGNIPEPVTFPLGLAKGVTQTSTPLVFGDSCIIEYREPAAADPGSFRISHVSHAYRWVDGFVEREGNCHVNVACSPEGDGWEGPIKATVRISVVVPQGTGWCTGTLVNNVRQDCEPYILSAYHCGRTSTTSQFNQYKFYFQFQYANCSGGSYSTSKFVTGSQLKAYSDDYNPAYQGLGGSDFMLLRLNNEIPESYDPYWAGWDARSISSVADDGVCIHHPTGAPKRVSSYTQTLTTGHPMASSGLMSHYKVVWAATQNGWGITEVGSSGAGLFKQYPGQGPVLIGTCTGNSSGMNCSNHAGYAYFGKMSYHWTQNPNAAGIKLKPWLDPDNTGTLVLGGSPNPCAITRIGDGAKHKDLSVYPNPSNGDLQMELPATMGGTNRLSVLDITGRTVVRRNLEGTGPHHVNLGHLPAGLYTLAVENNGKTRNTKISIQH